MGLMVEKLKNLVCFGIRGWIILPQSASEPFSRNFVICQARDRLLALVFT